VVIGRALPIGGRAPLLVLSALAVVMLAGKAIELYHQRFLGFAWAALLIVPAVLVPVAMILLPWTLGTDLTVTEPASAMGRFFANTFRERTGHPLAVVTGDVDTAALVALGAPSRPSVYFDDDPRRSPSVTPADIRKKGAIVVWLAANTNPTPPPAIKTMFPGLVPEVPHIFKQRVFKQPIDGGPLPLLRIGWGVIRPASTPTSTPKSTPKSTPTSAPPKRR
jgi:hypothetical protein